MNLRIAKLCLDCDEIANVDDQSCSVCTGRSFVPLVKYVEAMPQKKVSNPKMFIKGRRKKTTIPLRIQA